MEINENECMNDFEENNIPECKLSTKYDIGLDSSTGRAHILNVDNLPSFDGSSDSIRDIIDFLDVENSLRYKRTSKDTFCNIYSHDLANLMNCYIPRVWWVKSALETKNFDAQYLKTCRELNANELYEWFSDYGHYFGWVSLKSTSEAQKHANNNKCVIMVAANKNKSRSGHIVNVVPENSEHKAIGSGGITIIPLQSQAGGTNKKYFTSKWWSNMEKLKIFAKLD